MKLIVISSPAEITGEAKWVNQLFAAGLACFHLRKPAAPISYIEKLLLHLQPAYYERIVLPYYHLALAKTFGISRLHFPEQARKELPAWQGPKLRKEGYHLSTSVHALETLHTLPTFFQYTFFGPVFSSISKPGYGSVLPPDFRLQPSHQQVPVMALGGIDAQNIKRVKEMHFAGAAVLGTIWREPANALEQFITLKNICSQLAPTP